MSPAGDLDDRQHCPHCTGAAPDGGDAQVFPAFEERVNAIRGPLSIVGGPLAGTERFLNDPFRLPEETNDPQADGTVNGAGTDANGNATLFDHEAFHFNAVYGERPGFDPRMNDFPFEFTFLDGPALGRFLTPDPVEGVLDEPATLNRYVFARNAPTEFADPLGLAAFSRYDYIDYSYWQRLGISPAQIDRTSASASCPTTKLLRSRCPERVTIHGRIDRALDESCRSA